MLRSHRATIRVLAAAQGLLGGLAVLSFADTAVERLIEQGRDLGLIFAGEPPPPTLALKASLRVGNGLVAILPVLFYDVAGVEQFWVVLAGSAFASIAFVGAVTGFLVPLAEAFVPGFATLSPSPFRLAYADNYLRFVVGMVLGLMLLVELGRWLLGVTRMNTRPG